MQVGVDPTLGDAGVGVVLAPSNSSQFAPPFDYSLTRVDFATNTTKVIATWACTEFDPQTGRCTDGTAGVMPIFEGFPADVDTKRHVFWTILGLYSADQQNFVRTLVGFDMDTGKVVGSNALEAPPTLELFAYDATNDKLWGAGYSNYSGLGGTIALVEIDVETGKVGDFHAQEALGSSWQINELPGIVAFDGSQQALVFPAANTATGITNDISLVTLFVSGSASMASPYFCHLAKPGVPMSCPKMLHWAPSA